MRLVMLIDPSGFRLELLHRAGCARSHGRWEIGESLLTCGYGHIAVRVDDVAAAAQRLADIGATLLMPPSPGTQPGITIAFVADPEDNLIEIVSRH
jgi:catechol 2,3-dioxygenase-like lactoylglutathione lyase family enzyme